MSEKVYTIEEIKEMIYDILKNMELRKHIFLDLMQEVKQISNLMLIL